MLFYKFIFEYFRAVKRIKRVIFKITFKKRSVRQKIDIKRRADILSNEMLIWLYLRNAKYHSMSTITLIVPNSLTENKIDTVRFIASKLYESGRLSLGQAANVAGLSKRAFAEILHEYGTSYINYSTEDLQNELKNINM